MKHKTIEIFLFIDALGWKIVNDYSFLTELLPYRKKIDMQFGYSSSAIPTILSGKTPAEPRRNTDIWDCSGLRRKVRPLNGSPVCRGCSNRKVSGTVAESGITYQK